MSSYAGFFFNSKATVVELETVELSHPAFSKVYRVVRNALGGIDAVIEDGSTAHFDYYPVKIARQGANTDLDQTFQLTFGDLGAILPEELDAVATADGWLTKPAVTFRVYRSDNLAAILYGPVVFEGESIAFVKDSNTTTAGAPQLNTTTTGELYTLDRFPMLNGLLT